jgi:hypothetical protein
MEPQSPQFQKEPGRIEELINALNGAANSAVAAQARELVQALLELQRHVGTRPGADGKSWHAAR